MNTQSVKNIDKNTVIEVLNTNIRENILADFNSRRLGVENKFNKNELFTNIMELNMINRQYHTKCISRIFLEKINI